jgi:hypothetical protein
MFNDVPVVPVNKTLIGPVLPVATIVVGLTFPIVVIDQDGPAS